MTPQTTFVKNRNPFKPLMPPLNPDDLQITDDPLPAGRVVAVKKYAEIFGKIKLGQGIRVQTESVDRVANALRKYLETSTKKGQIKSTRTYIDPRTGKADTGFGRVWLLGAGK